MTERLRVQDLCVTYMRNDSPEHAVREVSFTVEPGEILGIVGESGSGKSSIAQAVMRLLPTNAILSGSVHLGDTDLVAASEKEMRRIRGSRIGMVFQDPASALNPVFTIATQIVDTLRQHAPEVSRRTARLMAGAAVEEMGVPASRLNSYPHELSGGMRQRALIAAAMAAKPAFLVADEPTSDLDTVSQAQILRLLSSLRDQRSIGMILISHDMRVVSSICDNVGVMCQGQLMEIGPTKEVFTRPRHRYTEDFLKVSRREREAGGQFVTMKDQALLLDATGTDV